MRSGLGARAKQGREARAGREDQAPPRQPGTRWAMLLCDAKWYCDDGPAALASLSLLPARACVRAYICTCLPHAHKYHVTVATRACRAACVCAHCATWRRRLGPDGSIRPEREGTSSFSCAVRWTRLRDCSIRRLTQALSAPWSCVVHTMLYIRAKSRNTVCVCVCVCVCLRASRCRGCFCETQSSMEGCAEKKASRERFALVVVVVVVWQRVART